MSLASIATSVPDPIAIPTSACASAAASLIPSPTIATTRPWSCKVRTTSSFSSGITSDQTRSIPTSAATAWATAAESPVNSTGSTPSAFNKSIACLLVGLIESRADTRATNTPSTLMTPRMTSTHTTPNAGCATRARTPSPGSAAKSVTSHSRH